MRMRVFDVARKAEFPALPLASTQNLTMTFLLDYVLAGPGKSHKGELAGATNRSLTVAARKRLFRLPTFWL